MRLLSAQSSVLNPQSSVLNPQSSVCRISCPSRSVSRDALSILDICFHHLLHKFSKGFCIGPAEDSPGLRTVTEQECHLSRPVELGVGNNVFGVIKPDRPESLFQKLANCVGLAGGDDVIVRIGLLKHQPHRPDVISSVPPVSPRLQISKLQLAGKTQ